MKFVDPRSLDDMSELREIAEKEDWETRVWELEATPIGIFQNFVRLERGLHVVIPWQRHPVVSRKNFTTCDIARTEDSSFVQLYNGVKQIISPDLHTLEGGRYRQTLTTFAVPRGYHIDYDRAVRERYPKHIQGVASYGPAA